MCAERKLASRAAIAALLLLSVILFTLPSFDPREWNSSAMSAQQAMQRLKALSPVQQRRAAAILGALLADVASKSRLLKYRKCQKYGWCLFTMHAHKVMP